MSEFMAYAVPITLVLVSGCVLWLCYLFQKYIRIIVNLFLGVQIKTIPEKDIQAHGERVRFRTRDGLTLSGVVVSPDTASDPIGTVVFSHEFGSDKHSCMKYADFLLEAGFRVFAFDYRNHGESEALEDYEPLHWFTDCEVADLEAALDYVASREDFRTDRIGLFGVSRGAATSLWVASRRPDIFAVVIDSAFSTYRTLIDYERKWVSIFARMRFVYRRLPTFVFNLLGKTAIFVSRVRVGRRFPLLEKRLGHCKCPVFYVHGQRDTYIDWQQAGYLAKRTGGPGSVWIVPEARHNHSRFVAPAEYASRVTEFLLKALPSDAARRRVGAESRTSSSS